ncbi:MAG: hypothetical protein Q9160_007285 [Pyrenula sp. 1 TL-2023]
MAINSDNINFTYAPLRAKDIRLLQLRRIDEGFIAGNLEIFSIDSPDCPRFTAFSYVWGPPIRNETITINDEDFHVLQNVYPLLDFVCNDVGFQDYPWVWIDSITINQHDLEERSSQVQLMARIFKESRNTIVWLGLATQETDEAMDFLIKLGLSKDELMRISDKISMFEDLPQEYQDERKWHRLEAFLMKPWWRRVWTLQEFIVPPEVTFYCGQRKIRRSHLQKAFSAIRICSPPLALLSAQSTHTIWNRWRLRDLHECYPERLSLLALIAHTAGSEATDPRDRIYSLLALTNETDRKMVARPTYQLPVENVYINLVRSFIDTYQSLDIICFSQLFHQPEDIELNTELTLPSWVPDWRRHVETFVTLLMVSQSTCKHIGNFRPVAHVDFNRSRAETYAAAWMRSPQVQFSAEFRQLSCRGIFLDYIDGIGGIGSLAKDYQPDPRKLSHLSLIQSTSAVNTGRCIEVGKNSAVDDNATKANSCPHSIDDILRCLVLDRADRYLTYPAITSRFYTRLLYLITSYRYSLFKDLLLAGGFTVEDVFLPAADPTIVAYNDMNLEDEEPPSMRNQYYDDFASRFHDTTFPDMMARRLMTTEKGHIGMVPTEARKRDLICVLFGCSVPMILRRAANERSYTFIGECYLHGFMNGEVFNRRNIQEEDFVLI